jgi:hypothetical protein
MSVQVRLAPLGIAHDCSEFSPPDTGTYVLGQVHENMQAARASSQRASRHVETSRQSVAAAL